MSTNFHRCFRFHPPKAARCTRVRGASDGALAGGWVCIIRSGDGTEFLSGSGTAPHCLVPSHCLVVAAFLDLAPAAAGPSRCATRPRGRSAGSRASTPSCSCSTSRTSCRPRARSSRDHCSVVRSSRIHRFVDSESTRLAGVLVAL